MDAMSDASRQAQADSPPVTMDAVSKSQPLMAHVVSGVQRLMVDAMTASMNAAPAASGCNISVENTFAAGIGTSLKRNR